MKATARFDNSVWGVIKGGTYTVKRIYWRGGEHKYEVEDLGEVPSIFFNEYGEEPEDLPGTEDFSC